MYDAINVASSGLQTYHTWLDVIANNVANVNDSSAANGRVYEERYLQISQADGDASEVDRFAGSSASGPSSRGAGDGVQADGVITDGKNGELVQDPSDPRANAEGYVRRSTVDLGQQMGFMMAAQRAFQANANMVERAKEMYQTALGIGKGV